MNAPPLLRQKHSPSSSSTESSRSRVASEELVVPETERMSSIYYGVDAFSPTLVDICTTEQRRVVWSSRAHRKMMTTLYHASYGRSFWRIYSLSYWASTCTIFANFFFVAGCLEEFVIIQSDIDASAIALINICFLTGAFLHLVGHILNYFEVINSCHNLGVIYSIEISMECFNILYCRYG
jgi:hypothetical protein